MIESTPVVVVVSLGPGEPDLITVSGIQTLKEANVIFCPGTNGRSRSADLLREMGISEFVLQIYTLPMSKNREQAHDAYNRVLEDAIRLREEKRNVAIVAEGDSGFYSSTGYLVQRLKNNDIPVKQIAGVPAFIAAAASVGISVVEQEERLTVCPGEIDEALIGRIAAGREVAVVMKLSQCEKEMKQYIEQTEGVVFHYFENVGRGNEFYTCDPTQVVGREFPYFSLMIIKKQSN